MPRRGEVGAWVLLAMVGTLAGVGVVEIGVRALHLVPDRFWEPDAELGTRHIAGKAGWWTQEEREFCTYVRINGRGLRDVEHRYEKAEGVRRILILGDSFIEALQVPQHQMIGRQLESKLGDGYEVISAGVSGYGTASQLLFLQREGVRYAPDVVTLAFYPGNDVKNNSPTLEEVLRPVYADDGRLLRVHGHASAQRGWRHRLHAYQFGRQQILRNPALIAQLNRLGLTRATGPRVVRQREGIPVDYWVFALEADQEWLTAWRHTEELLARMHNSLTASGGKLVTVIIPSRYQIHPEWWAETVAAHPAMRGRKWDLGQPARRLAEWCAAHGVACLDLYPGLSAAVAEGESLYFRYDGHWTAAGHEVAARLVADFLEQRSKTTTH